MKPERLVPHGRDKRKLNFNDLVRGVRIKDMGLCVGIRAKSEKRNEKDSIDYRVRKMSIERAMRIMMSIALMS